MGFLSTDGHAWPHFPSPKGWIGTPCFEPNKRSVNSFGTTQSFRMAKHWQRLSMHLLYVYIERLGYIPAKVHTGLYIFVSSLLQGYMNRPLVAHLSWLSEMSKWCQVMFEKKSEVQEKCFGWIFPTFTIALSTSQTIKSVAHDGAKQGETFGFISNSLQSWAFPIVKSRYFPKYVSFVRWWASRGVSMIQHSVIPWPSILLRRGRAKDRIWDHGVLVVQLWCQHSLVKSESQPECDLAKYPVLWLKSM